MEMEVVLECNVKDLKSQVVGAALQDFDFDLKLNVTGFSFKVSGQPTIKVNGRKLNSQASGALKRQSVVRPYKFLTLLQI